MLGVTGMQGGNTPSARPPDIPIFKNTEISVLADVVFSFSVSFFNKKENWHELIDGIR